MVVLARRRLAMHGRGFEAAPWFQRALPKRGVLSAADLTVGFMAALALAWWMSSAQVLVASTWRAGGTVLACHYVAATRVVELQILRGLHEPRRSACPLIRFG
jgi:hypothetical protein